MAQDTYYCPYTGVPTYVEEVPKEDGTKRYYLAGGFDPYCGMTDKGELMQALQKRAGNMTTPGLVCPWTDESLVIEKRGNLFFAVSDGFHPREQRVSRQSVERFASKFKVDFSKLAQTQTQAPQTTQAPQIPAAPSSADVPPAPEPATNANLPPAGPSPGGTTKGTK